MQFCPLRNGNIFFSHQLQSAPPASPVTLRGRVNWTSTVVLPVGASDSTRAVPQSSLRLLVLRDNDKLLLLSAKNSQDQKVASHAFLSEEEHTSC